jgi:hypothetical protein
MRPCVGKFGDARDIAFKVNFIVALREFARAGRHRNQRIHPDIQERSIQVGAIDGERHRQTMGVHQQGHLFELRMRRRLAIEMQANRFGGDCRDLLQRIHRHLLLFAKLHGRYAVRAGKIANSGDLDQHGGVYDVR